MSDTTTIKAATFRPLLAQRDEARLDVQEVHLMILAGFCHNCPADGPREADEAAGQQMDREQAREHMYEMPFGECRAMLLHEANQWHTRASGGARARHG